MPNDLIVVMEVGRTNSRMSLVDLETGQITWTLQRRCGTTQTAGLRSLDVAGIECLLLAALAGAPGKERIRAIVPVAPAATAVFISSSGQVLAAPDCEDPVFERIDPAYQAVRDPFEQTLSPAMPQGRNLGKQIFYLQQRHPEIFASVSTVLSYPQYWSWRLSGVLASEFTSLGCHTDLWRPREAGFSGLVQTQGWQSLLPAARGPGDTLGPVSAPLVKITGLDAQCQVLCGVNDVNAALLCHRGRHEPGEPYTLVTSGPWCSVLAPDGELERLREASGMLANVDATGLPIATARFMGGREYEAIATIATAGAARPQPSPETLRSVLDKRALALPPFADAGGPFSGRLGKLVNAETLDDRERAALATLYCALETDLLLDMLGTDFPVLLEGPMATNPFYGRLLASFRPGTPVSVEEIPTSALECARYLLGKPSKGRQREALPLQMEGLESYRNLWRNEASARLASTDPVPRTGTY